MNMVRSTRKSLLLLALLGLICRAAAAESDAQAEPKISTDPAFSGFDGVGFTFTGLPDKYFNILSEGDHQINAYFLPSKESEDNTYIAAFGVQYGTHKLAVRTNAEGELSVELNGEAQALREGEDAVSIELPAQKGLGAATLIWERQHPQLQNAIELRTPLLSFAVWPVIPADGSQLPFLDSRVSLLTPPAMNRMQGVLGESYLSFVDNFLNDTPLRSSGYRVSGKERPELEVRDLFDTKFEDSLFMHSSMDVEIASLLEELKSSVQGHY